MASTLLLGGAHPQQGEDHQFFTCYRSFGAKAEQKAVEIQSESSESLKQQTFRIPAIVPEEQQSDSKLCFVICIRTAFPSESTDDSDNEPCPYQVSDIPGAGRGLIAKRDIKKGN